MSPSEVAVTVVIPALDEEADIAGCLRAVAAQTHPPHLVDVVLVDGCSRDRTVEVARKEAAELGLELEVVPNARRRTSTSLNAGLARARGDVLVRIDARSRVQDDHIERCVELLGSRPDIGVVGGRQVPSPRSGAALDRGIARALRNRYTTGLARYRRAPESGPTDTVWMGSFRTEELRALGGWDDAVALNEDWALNRAYRDSGAVVWFDAGMAAVYLPRPDLASLARQYFYFGRVKGLWWARGVRPEPRQVAILGAPPAAALALALSVRRWGPRALVAIPAALVLGDAVGSDEGAGPAERAIAASVIATYTASWWLGTVVGVAGEVLGVEHRHRSVPT